MRYGDESTTGLVPAYANMDAAQSMGKLLVFPVIQTVTYWFPVLGIGTARWEDHLIGWHATEPRRLCSSRYGSSVHWASDQRSRCVGPMREVPTRCVGWFEQTATRGFDCFRSTVLAVYCLPADIQSEFEWSGKGSFRREDSFWTNGTFIVVFQVLGMDSLPPQKFQQRQYRFTRKRRRSGAETAESEGAFHFPRPFHGWINSMKTNDFFVKKFPGDSKLSKKEAENSDKMDTNDSVPAATPTVVTETSAPATISPENNGTANV